MAKQSAQRNSHGRKQVDSCMVTLLIGGSLITGLSFLICGAVRWVA